MPTAKFPKSLSTLKMQKNERETGEQGGRIRYLAVMILQCQKNTTKKIPVCPILVVTPSTTGNFYIGKVCKAFWAMEGAPEKSSPSLASNLPQEGRRCAAPQGWFSLSKLGLGSQGLGRRVEVGFEHSSSLCVQY